MKHSCRAGWSGPGRCGAVQASSSMLCRFALWFVGTAYDLAGHHCYATLADLSQTKWLCELINSTAWLFIIAMEVHWAVHWTRAKINDWKRFVCITLLHCCCEFCLLIDPENSRCKRYFPFLTKNADYWGTPELPTEFSFGELGCPLSCTAVRTGFSRERIPVRFSTWIISHSFVALVLVWLILKLSPCFTTAALIKYLPCKYSSFSLSIHANWKG